MVAENLSSNRSIVRWLDLMIIAIAIMVLIGGITRLTESGLSMTDWRFIGGAVPPMNLEAWEAKFELYKDSPQHRIINSTMTLEEFKGIFWWEYIHRMWGRLLGSLFVIPFLYFLIQKAFDARRIKLLLIAFLLGGAQGLFGWFMVQSGLEDRPWVSPVRLTVHLLLALFLLGFLTWNRLEISRAEGDELKPRFIPPWLYYALPAVVVLFAVQFSFGGLMAGLRAAMDYPSFPTMNGQWIPDLIWKPAMAWHNLVENATFVHVVHRSLGSLLLVLASVLGVAGWNYSQAHWSRYAFASLVAVVWFQFGLGILTVINSMGSIPLVYGVLHQFGAVFLAILFSCLLFARAHEWKVAK